MTKGQTAHFGPWCRRLSFFDQSAALSARHSLKLEGLVSVARCASYLGDDETFECACAGIAAIVCRSKKRAKDIADESTRIRDSVAEYVRFADGTLSIELDYESYGTFRCSPIRLDACDDVRLGCSLPCVFAFFVDEPLIVARSFSTGAQIKNGFTDSLFDGIHWEGYTIYSSKDDFTAFPHDNISSTIICAHINSKTNFMNEWEVDLTFDGFGSFPIRLFPGHGWWCPFRVSMTAKVINIVECHIINAGDHDNDLVSVWNDEEETTFDDWPLYLREDHTINHTDVLSSLEKLNVFSLKRGNTRAYVIVTQHFLAVMMRPTGTWRHVPIVTEGVDDWAAFLVGERSVVAGCWRDGYWLVSLEDEIPNEQAPCRRIPELSSAHKIASVGDLPDRLVGVVEDHARDLYFVLFELCVEQATIREIARIPNLLLSLFVRIFEIEDGCFAIVDTRGKDDTHIVQVVEDALVFVTSVSTGVVGARMTY
jgi:hypothetical protein